MSSTFASVRRWLLRVAIVSAPVAGTLASCGGDDSATPSPTASTTSGASGGGTGNASTGSAGAETTGGDGAIGVGSGGAGVATGAGGGGTSGSAGARGSTCAGDAGPCDSGAGGSGGGPTDGSGGSDGRCISGEGGPCGGFIVNPCSCGDGLVCIPSPIPDAAGVCRIRDGGTADAGPRVCTGSCDRCARGVCCGASCCGVGEWCDESSGTPTCKCGTLPGCVMPNTCRPLGPINENGCGAVCCTTNCPV